MILEEKKVTFLEAIKHFWKGYFDFRGRSKRSGYWWAVLFIYLVYIIMGLIGVALFMNNVSSAIMTGFFIILVIYALSVAIPGLMLTFRRWRDVGLNNNGILIYFILLLAFGVISVYYTTFGNMLISLCSIISFVLSLLPSDKLTTNSNNAILTFLFRKR